jgi:hypothetical protein
MNDKKLSKLTMKENEMTLKQDLQALNNDIKALSKTVDNLLKAVEKSEKPKAAKKAPAKPVKAKTTKNAPAKKAPAKKKPRKLTATDIVLGAIAAQKKGISVGDLIIKTRFSEKKIQNIIYKACKKGKIKRVGKGVFTGV